MRGFSFLSPLNRVRGGLNDLTSTPCTSDISEISNVKIIGVGFDNCILIELIQ